MFFNKYVILNHRGQGLRAQAKLAHDAHDPVLQISKKTMNYQMLLCVGSSLPFQKKYGRRWSPVSFCTRYDAWRQSV